MKKSSKRTIIQKSKLGASDDDRYLKQLSPDELIGMMWQLALDAWSFKENLNAEPRLQRHVVILKRGKG